MRVGVGTSSVDPVASGTPVSGEIEYTATLSSCAFPTSNHRPEGSMLKLRG